MLSVGQIEVSRKRTTPSFWWVPWYPQFHQSYSQNKPPPYPTTRHQGLCPIRGESQFCLYQFHSPSMAPGLFDEIHHPKFEDTVSTHPMYIVKMGHQRMEIGYSYG